MVDYRVDCCFMHDANVLGFTKRRRGIGIIGVERLSPARQPSALWVGTAKSATLHYGDETVTVKNIHRGGMGGALIGNISGFERSPNGGDGGMQVGDDIAFQEEHVFTIEA